MRWHLRVRVRILRTVQQQESSPKSVWRMWILAATPGNKILSPFTRRKTTTLLALSVLSSSFSSSQASSSTSPDKIMSCNAITRHPIGLGTFMMDRDAVPAAVQSALVAGYRRIDCAPVYFNEHVVGDALKLALDKRTVKRKDLFLVSKLASPFHQKRHVKSALLKTLTDLRVDYLDLYLIHWPVAFYPVPIDPSKRGWDDQEIDESDGGKRIDPTVSIHETWQGLEELVDSGLVKHIGVSNFSVSLLHELMTRARIPPAVNQCEAHPYLQQQGLVDYCHARGVNFQAYSALGTASYKETDEPVVLDDAILKGIAIKHNCTTAAVCLAWAIQRGTTVVAKSTSEQHLHENLAAGCLTLDADDMAAIAELDRGYRFFRPQDWWGDMAMAVFD